MYIEAKQEAEFIIRHSVKENLKYSFNTRDTMSTSDNIPTDAKGYCIRCGKIIFFDPYKPLCKDCFFEWDVYQNIDYPEKYCHSCGKRDATTMEKPLCYDCYRGVGVL